MKVDLLGTSFTLQSDEDPEYLETVTNFFASKVEEIRGSVETGDPVKLAILAGILVVDELFKEKGADQDRRDRGRVVSDQESGNIVEGDQPAIPFSSEELEEAERITLELIDKIDSTLEEAAISKHPVNEE